MKVCCKDCEWFEDSFLGDIFCTPKKPENIEEKFDFTYGGIKYSYREYSRRKLNECGLCPFFTQKYEVRKNKNKSWYKKLFDFFKKL